MPDRNRLQAMFPEGSLEIFNAQGTAPGVDVSIPREGGRRPARFFALPGVPAEMKSMFHDVVSPRVQESSDAGAMLIRHHVVKCFGSGRK